MRTIPQEMRSAFQHRPLAFELARPVLLVHGDNDRNVPFQQTTDLVEKLRAQTSRSKS